MICRLDSHIKNKVQHYQSKIVNKMAKKKHTSSQLEYVLKKLLPPNNKTIVRSFGVFIPEICFYKDGEAHSLYLNSEHTEQT